MLWNLKGGEMTALENHLLCEHKEQMSKTGVKPAWAKLVVRGSPSKPPCPLLPVLSTFILCCLLCRRYTAVHILA